MDEILLIPMILLCQRRSRQARAPSNQSAMQGEVFGEGEAAALRLLSTDVVAGEDLLTHVVLLGMTPSPLDAADALGILDALLRRTAAQAAARGGARPPAAAVLNEQLPAAVLQLALYQARASQGAARMEEYRFRVLVGLCPVRELRRTMT